MKSVAGLPFLRGQIQAPALPKPTLLRMLSLTEILGEPSKSPLSIPPLTSAR